MGQSTWSGPIRAGTIREGASANVGNAVLTQTATFDFNDATAWATGIILPAGAQIIDQIVDVTTDWDNTTAAVQIGTAADPDAYGNVATLVAAGGRIVVDPNGTQCAAIDDIGTTDVPVYMTITNTGSPTAGAARLTITYRQN